MLKKIVGHLSKESGFKQRMRFHQAWWRSFVLAEDEGQHPTRKNELIGSMLQKGKFSWASTRLICGHRKTVAKALCF